ncbi:MAG: transglycosylase domain-containing protein [Ruminococcus sp.]|nr:transglycosylase domain-containing protein [Ruminococcus sp.]
MRNKRETDISRYTEVSLEPTVTVRKQDSGAKKFFKGLGKVLLTFAAVLTVAGIIAGISLSIYIFSLASEPTGIDLKAKSMNQTSHILVKNSDGEFKEYQKLYSKENRIWVNNEDIPQAMRDAQVAIEDKRFFEHIGVDWTRTLSAMANLATDGSSYGGSTITQQLIKNITNDNEVSINRKLREICKALKLEQEYTKDQILEAYLNVVNFGNNCQGVESAAQLYFDKSIKDCSVAECAAIAGITQNPSRWNPLVYPDQNKIRREIVISEMYDQGYLSKDEYDKAMKESEEMKFIGFQNVSDDEDDEDNDYVQNWYIDQLYYDLKRDLAQYYNISEDAASDKLFTEGLKIYCAMDEDMQEYMEDAAKGIDKSSDPDLQVGSVLMDFDGRVIATVGSSKRKTQALEWDRATHSTLQPGSSIKPVFVYPLAIDNKQLYYSSIVLDDPIEKYAYDPETGYYKSGPGNWYSGSKGNMLLPDAIEWSSNNTAARVMELIGGPSVAYEQAVTKMGFKKLNEEDSEITGALSIGGMNGGVSVREMAAAYTYMGNGGLYYEPYTYYYVTDSEDNIIIDKRDNIPKQAYSAETATIMNRLLHYNMTVAAHTKAAYAKVDGWDIVGKTGTTNSDRDCWYCGLSPYAVMAVWTGFDLPDTISDTTQSCRLFSKVMGEYLKGKEQKEYKLSENTIQANYNPVTGLITSTDNPTGKYVGWYTEDNMPSYGSAYYEESSWDSDYDGYDYDQSSYDYDYDYYTPNQGGGDVQSSAAGQGSADAQSSAAEQPPAESSAAAESSAVVTPEPENNPQEQAQPEGGGQEQAPAQ